MGIFNFGKKTTRNRNKTMIVLDWDRISSALTDLSFLQDKKNPELHIYSRKPQGVLLEDIQKRYPTVIHEVPNGERNFGNYMAVSVAYHFANSGEYAAAFFVLEGKGQGTTIRFLKALDISVDSISIGGDDRRSRERPERGERGERPERKPRGRNEDRNDSRSENRNDNRRGNRNEEGEESSPRPERGERGERGERSERGERGGRGNRDRNQRREPLDKNDTERKGHEGSKERKPRYEATEEDAAKLAARFREQFNLFKDFNQEQMAILVKQATGQDMQVVFGSRSPKRMAEALANAGLGTAPEEGKFRLSEFPSEDFCRKLLRVNGERLPRPERSPKPARVESPEPQDRDDYDKEEPQADTESHSSYEVPQTEETPREEPQA